MTTTPDGLAAIIDLLRCPSCTRRLVIEGQEVVCAESHRSDIARQGFVTLSRGGITRPGDTASMVMARDRVQLSRFFDKVRDHVVDVVPEWVDTVLDVGAGTGFYAAPVVDVHASRRGIALDTSKPALKRASRAHPRLAAVGMDLADELPICDGVMDCCLVIFAPRPVTEIARVLASRGLVVVVTPRTGHLKELQGPMGMLKVPDGKVEMLIDQFGDGWASATTVVQDVLDVDASGAADLALMGPTGFHAEPAQLHRRAARLLGGSATMSVALDVSVTTLSRITVAGQKAH